MSNRKLIRTTLAEVKGKVREVPPQRERSNNGSHRGPSERDGGRESSRESGRVPQASAPVRKRTPPPMETNAELFYYKKQMDAHADGDRARRGDEVVGTIFGTTAARSDQRRSLRTFCFSAQRQIITRQRRVEETAE